MSQLRRRLMMQRVGFLLDDYIPFADPAVEAICAQNWGSGGKITYRQAAAVTTLNNRFRRNANITSFDELQYFTSLTTINAYDFQQCYALQSVMIPSNITILKLGAFAACTALRYVKGSFANLKSIEAGVFRNNSLMISVPSVADELLTIGNNAFDGCTALASGLNSMHKITSVGGYAFRNTPNLRIELDCPVLQVIYGNGFEKTGVTKAHFGYDGMSLNTRGFANSKSLQEVILPEVTSIADFFFDGCTALKILTLTGSVVPTAGTYTFRSVVFDHIHVPASLVETYKATAPWSNYASVISAIV